MLLSLTLKMRKKSWTSWKLHDPSDWFVVVVVYCVVFFVSASRGVPVFGGVRLLRLDVLVV